MTMKDFDDINRILAEMNHHNMIEPIDDDSLEIHLDEWASVVGVADEFFPEYDDFQDNGSF